MRPLGALVLSVLLGATTVGCSLDLTEPQSQAENTCIDDTACGTTGVCLQGMCVSNSADLQGLLLHIEVPANAANAQGASVVIDPASQGALLQGPAGGGYYQALDLSTPDIVGVRARLAVDPLPAACGDLQGSGGFPMALELRPVRSAIGLPLKSYTASSTAEAEHEVSLDVPRGDYDIYLTPVVPEGEDGQSAYPGCEIPPVILFQQELTQATTSFVFEVATPTTLTGTLEGLDVSGWTIDLVDNRQGRPIATSATLQTEPNTTSTTFALQFWPEVLADEEKVDPILRLRPSEEDALAGMPSLLWHLASVDLDDDKVVALTLEGLAGIEALEVEGQVRDADASAPAPATVSVQSISIDADFGGNLSYRRTLETDSEGAFTVSLIPGEYRVVANPTSEGLAVTEVKWSISPENLGSVPSCQIAAKSRLLAAASTPTGMVASNLSVLLQPSTPPAATYLQRILTKSDLQPDAAAGTTDAAGIIDLDADPGEFDLSLRPPTQTNLPWLVRARVSVPPSIPPVETPQTADLGAIAISHPVVFEGTVRSAQGYALGGSSVRAWLPLSDPADPDAPPRVIEVGNTTADATGHYRLLLPASISR